MSISLGTLYFATPDRANYLLEHFEDFSIEDAREALDTIWTMDGQVAIEDDMNWLWMFEQTGFIVDGVATEREKTFLTSVVDVYRGCTFEGVRRMAWSTDINVASRFADNSLGEVFSMTIPVEYILATTNQRKEYEVILDINALIDDGYAPQFMKRVNQ